LFKQWITDMRVIGAEMPEIGACALSTAMELWLWTYHHLETAKDANGRRLMQGQRQGVTFSLADALCWLLATRYQILDVVELATQGPQSAIPAENLKGYVTFFSDLANVHCARAAGEVGRITSELVYGYDRHPAWQLDECGGCSLAVIADVLDEAMPGYSAYSEKFAADIDRASIEPDKAGPCPCKREAGPFEKLRKKMDGCLTGTRLAKDRAGQSLVNVMIPAALDYPA